MFTFSGRKVNTRLTGGLKFLAAPQSHQTLSFRMDLIEPQPAYSTTEPVQGLHPTSEPVQSLHSTTEPVQSEFNSGPSLSGTGLSVKK